MPSPYLVLVFTQEKLAEAEGVLRPVLAVQQRVLGPGEPLPPARWRLPALTA